MGKYKGKWGVSKKVLVKQKGFRMLPGLVCIARRKIGTQWQKTSLAWRAIPRSGGHFDLVYLAHAKPEAGRVINYQVEAEFEGLFGKHFVFGLSAPSCFDFVVGSIYPVRPGQTCILMNADEGITHRYARDASTRSDWKVLDRLPRSLFNLLEPYQAIPKSRVNIHTASESIWTLCILQNIECTIIDWHFGSLTDNRHVHR